jgi:tRNA threonylcarbamoyladenosine biosynthesis protein TsaB
MPALLLIETATGMCSVALSVDGEITALHEKNEGQAHARLVPFFMEQCLRDSGRDWLSLDGIAVSKGPGSYTGLRIGVAAAKGACFAAGIPLIAINTLQSMVCVLANNEAFHGYWFCPMIDARRMEVYTAFFNESKEMQGPVSAEIIGPEFIAKFPQDRNLVFFGDGMSKSRPLLESVTNAVFVNGFTPSATGMNQLALDAYKKGVFEDVNHFEPFYLKDFFSPAQPNADSNRR